MKRAVFALALTLLMSCSDVQPELLGGPAQQSVPPSSTSTSTTSLMLPVPYRAAQGEPLPEAKEAAAAVVQALTTYDPAGSTLEAAGRRLEALGVPHGVAERSGALLVPGARSAGDIVYPQLGGALVSSASVMVVVRQRLLREAQESAFTRTVDVRLTSRDSRWIVEDIASVGGGPPTAPAPLSAAARRLLGHPRIQLPDSARWDVEAGKVNDVVSNLLADLADRYALGVAVFSSGHPINVFGTSRMSNHSVGRAVDIWSVDGSPVAQLSRSPALRALVEELLARGVGELGSPIDPDGPGGVAFTDIVHQDHLHIGFYG